MKQWQEEFPLRNLLNPKGGIQNDKENYCYLAQILY